MEKQSVSYFEERNLRKIQKQGKTETGLCFFTTNIAVVLGKVVNEIIKARNVTGESR